MSALNAHINGMARTHPHAEAIYRVVSLSGGSFGVEVSIPDTYPATVSKFATEADAEAWIAKHKSRVEEATSANFGVSRWRSSRITVSSAANGTG
jgi:hypothetical protein